MSEKGLSIFDVGKLSEPATALINCVSNAIGIVHDPRRIREKAKAEADAKIILAVADAEAQEFAFRASERIGYREIRRQKNIEAITLGAVDILEQEFARIEGSKSSGESQEQTESKAQKGGPDDDWIHQFYNYCNDVGDKDMQVLWSKILDGEFQNRGSFSLRVLNTVSMLSKEDSELFTKCCSLAWLDVEGPFIFSFSDLIFPYEEKERENGNEYLKWDVSYSDLNYLENFGLINLDTFSLTPRDGTLVAYGTRFFKLSAPEDTSLRFHGFTDIGAALLPISGATSLPKDFSDWVINQVLQCVDVEEIPEDQIDLK